MIKFLYHEKAVQSPGWRIVPAGLHELMTNDYGFDIGSYGVGWDDNLVCAMDEDKPVGVIAWRPNDDNKISFICLGYVLPEYRRQGIYGKMLDYVIEKATEKGLVDVVFQKRGILKLFLKKLIRDHLFKPWKLTIKR